MNDDFLNEWMDCLAKRHLTEMTALRHGALGLLSFDYGLSEQLQENLKLQDPGHRIGKHRGKDAEDTHFSSLKKYTQMLF